MNALLLKDKPSVSRLHDEIKQVHINKLEGKLEEAEQEIQEKAKDLENAIKNPVK